MDPSGSATYGQTQHDMDDPDAKGLGFTAAFHDPSPESLRAPTGEDTVPAGKGPDCGLQPSKAGVREQKAKESIGKTKEQRGWRKIVSNFTPS